MICKAVAEGASAFYFYKVGKGELFFTCEKFPQQAKPAVSALLRSSLGERPLDVQRPFKNTLGAERARPWGFAPLPHSLFQRRGNTLKEKRRFSNGDMDLVEKEGGRGHCLYLPVFEKA